MSSKKQDKGLAQNRVFTGAVDPNKPVGNKNPPVETQFQKGVSGNPGGRPHKLSDAYARVLKSKFPPALMEGAPTLQLQVKEYAGTDETGKLNPITYADKIALSQSAAAATGDTQAAREIRAATEGENVNINDQAYASWFARLKALFNEIGPEPDSGTESV